MDKGHKWSSIKCHIEQRNGSSSGNCEPVLDFHQDPKRKVLTCRCNPSGLSWVRIECRCNKQHVRGEEENCGDFEKAHEYDARSPSMID